LARFHLATRKDGVVRAWLHGLESRVDVIATCPECGSRAVREARRLGLWERLGAIVGYLPVRCRACGHRYRRSTLILREFYYAHCPACLSKNLTDWDEKYFYPGGFTTLLRMVGAKEHRCGPCRRNFVSFRPRKKARPTAAPPNSQSRPISLKVQVASLGNPHPSPAIDSSHPAADSIRRP
jgi:predicted Zn-ribbon and HTH transcriptional regulator